MFFATLFWREPDLQIYNRAQCSSLCWKRNQGLINKKCRRSTWWFVKYFCGVWPLYISLPLHLYTFKYQVSILRSPKNIAITPNRRELIFNIQTARYLQMCAFWKIFPFPCVLIFNVNLSIHVFQDCMENMEYYPHVT